MRVSSKERRSEGAGMKRVVGFPLLPWPGIGPKAFLHRDARPTINGAHTALRPGLSRLIINTRAKDKAEEGLRSRSTSITNIPCSASTPSHATPTHTHRDVDDDAGS